MTDYGKKQSENREYFKRALAEVMARKGREIEEEAKRPTASIEDKMRANQLFREVFGDAPLPFPEVDNLYENPNESE